MRVLMLITDCATGGAEYQTIRICRELIRQQNEVFFVSMIPAEDDIMKNSLISMGLTYFDLGMSRGKASLGSARRLIRLCREIKPDVIHSHMIHANLLLRFVSPVIRNPRKINTIHGEEEFLGKRKIIYKMTDAMVDYTVCCGEALFEQAKKLHIAGNSRLKYICNGLNTADYSFDPRKREQYRNEFGIHDCFTWITVGRLSKVKNQLYLLKEIQKVKGENEEVKLILTGDGPEKETLEQFVRESGLGDTVIFIGNRRDVPDLLSMADAFVLSSVHEGLPLSLQEAGAAGLPLVSTDVGGCDEVIQSGINGFLCESNKPGALSDCMIRIMNYDAEKRQQMGKASKEIVEKKFDMTNVIRQWEALYK